MTITRNFRVLILILGCLGRYISFGSLKLGAVRMIVWRSVPVLIRSHLPEFLLVLPEHKRRVLYYL
jgi:hypothetical protein